MAEQKKRVRVVSFEATADERVLIDKIIERAEQEDMFSGYDRQSLEMDLIATHANGCPLDFQRLLDATQFDFLHDLYGIVRHLDRRSGQLTRFFRPRCAVPAQANT